VEQFDLGLGDGRLIIDGNFDGPPNVDRTDLTFDWQVSSLNKFSKIAGRDFPDLPAHLKFHVTGNKDVISVEHIDALIGESDIQGSFSLRGGDIPTIALDVSADRIDRNRNNRQRHHQRLRQKTKTGRSFRTRRFPVISCKNSWPT
jgi:hypothetical protein